MSALNPNHPVTQELGDNWHKIVAILMMRVGITKFTITEEDIDRLVLDGENVCVVADCRNGGITVSLHKESEAAAIARAAGGLPN